MIDTDGDKRMNTMIKSYQVGSKVIMTPDAVEHYGNKWKNKVFTVIHVAVNTKQHPGFDDCAGCALYDLEHKGTNYGNSLYDYELMPAL